MFSAIIKSLRMESGLTQTQLARKIGVSPGNIGDWETGRSKPGYAALAELSRFFKVPADELLELSSGNGEKGTGPRREGNKPPHGQNLLTAGEADLIAMYRLLPSGEREDIFDLVWFKYKKHVEGTMESAFRAYAADQSEQEDTDSGKVGSQ